MNQFTIKIKELEDSLLARLSAAGGNFLGDYALVENLENTKRTAAEIEVKVAEGKNTEIKINEAREQYRPAAARSSLLYFILNDLNKINPIYQFSLKVSWQTVVLQLISRPLFQRTLLDYRMQFKFRIDANCQYPQNVENVYFSH